MSFWELIRGLFGRKKIESSEEKLAQKITAPEAQAPRALTIEERPKPSMSDLIFNLGLKISSSNTKEELEECRREYEQLGIIIQQSKSGWGYTYWSERSDEILGEINDKLEWLKRVEEEKQEKERKRESERKLMLEAEKEGLQKSALTLHYHLQEAEKAFSDAKKILCHLDRRENRERLLEALRNELVSKEPSRLQP